MVTSARNPLGLALRTWIVRRLSGPAGKPAAGASSDFAVAIVKLDRLGDFVLALGAIRALLQQHGPERCVLIVSAVATELAAREFPRTRRIVLPHSIGHFRAWRAAQKHRREISALRVEKVVCLRHQRWDYDELVLSWFNVPICLRTEDGVTRRLDASLRLYDCPTPGAFVPQKKNLGAVSDGSPLLCRELELHRQVLEKHFARSVTDTEAIPVLPTATASAGILVSPFGSESIKDFPAPLLRATLREAAARLREPVTFVGVATDHERLTRLASECEQDVGGKIAVRSNFALVEFLAAVGGAKLVISADTSTAHIATACDRPTVIALGGGHFGQFGPWRRSARQRWLIHPLDCFGCGWNCTQPAPYCLLHLTDAEATAAVAQALANASPSSVTA